MAQPRKPFRVLIDNIGPLPRRTEVELDAALTAEVLRAGRFDAANVPKTYRCLDCGFATRDLGVMTQHQADDLCRN